MTVTYTKEIATAGFSCFLKLLTRWRGSIYQLLWKDFIIFVTLYYSLALTYMLAMDENQRKIFERIARYCEANDKLVTVAFILGFFVTQVMSRWWSTLGHIPWPDRMAMLVTANVHGLEEECRAVRRTLLRYFNLAYVLAMSRICPPVRKRFPTLEHMVEAGILTKMETGLLLDLCGQSSDKPDLKVQSHDTKFIEPNLFCVPLAWAASLLGEARLKKWIRDDCSLKSLVDEINEYRGHLQTLFVYDTITLPLVYTQVVTIAVYMFFLACLMGRQFLADDPNNVYVPLFTFLEFFFYMGWLKVAECLANPFGEDADDFDINSLIDRNLQVSYMVVDAAHGQHPALIKDMFWDRKVSDVEMPYTPESEPFRVKNPNMGSAMDLSPAETKSSSNHLESIVEECSPSANNIPEYIRQHSDRNKTKLRFGIMSRARSFHHVARSQNFKRPTFERSNTVNHPDEFSKGSRADFIIGAFPRNSFARETSEEANTSNGQTKDDQFSKDEVEVQEGSALLENMSSRDRRSKFKSKPDEFSQQITDSFNNSSQSITSDNNPTTHLQNSSRDKNSLRDHFAVSHDSANEDSLCHNCGSSAFNNNSRSDKPADTQSAKHGL